MVSSNAGKRRGWRIAMAALTFGTIAVAGMTTSPANADEGRHRGWDRHEWRHDGWDHHARGWGWHRPYRYGYGYGWYEPPPAVYGPPAYYPGSLNVYIPLR